MRSFDMSLFALLLMITTAGCDVGALSLIASEPYDTEVQSIAQSQQYLQPSFIRVNRDPYPTELSATDLIDVYISGDDARDFWQVDPESSAPAQGLPEAAVIVRVVMDPQLNPSKLTFMIKGPPGFFPGGGDYYYAVTGLDGTIALSDTGEPQAGAIEVCGSCHAQRANSDFLFGVPTTNRGKLPTPAAVHGGEVETRVHDRGVDSPAFAYDDHHGR